ncbi:MAG: FAD-dependent oxidoreductase [Actinobacteria bacterium]|nr:FAD-dependent oxidoreductase [Actinomycetota bacterium]
MRVVVVGAGLAGLSAAESLARGGADVVLLEATDRVGGRVRTVTLGDHVVETGAEWVDSTHWRMHELMTRYGVEREGEGMVWSTIRRWLFWDGIRYAGEHIADVDPGAIEELGRFDEMIDATGDAMPDPSRPSTHPEAGRLDALSLADAIDEAALGPVAQLFARRNSQGEFAAEPSDVSLLFVAQQRAQERAELERLGVEFRAHRVVGGLSRIVDGLWRDVSRKIDTRTGAPIVWIDQSVDSVRVGTADGSVVEADHLVLAMPLGPLRTVEFRTPLPSDLHRAVNGLRWGHITKTAVRFAHREWLRGYGTTDSVSQRLYEPTIDQSGEPGVLMSYCGGDGGLDLASRAEDERIATITADMRRVHGITADAIGAVSQAWPNSEFAQGAYSVYRPGEVLRYWDVLRAPWGRVHLAGEHVATCTGYMEGAVESGRTVAARILAD